VYGDKRTFYCTSECALKNSRRVNKKKRRAKMRGVEADNIDPIKVFKDSGWICYLCWTVTDWRKRGTHEANAPELDHIVPLSIGGSHTADNVACSCRSCNNRKSDSVGYWGMYADNDKDFIKQVLRGYIHPHHAT
jgi:hypothetical protein